MKRGTASLLFAAAAVVGTCAPAAAQPALTPSEIDAAIAWGASGRALPYQLHTWADVLGSRSERIHDRVLGVVYTPFVRVALAARAARLAHGSFTAADVGGRAEPVVHVAFRWYCCDDVHGTTPEMFDPFRPFDYRIALPGEPISEPQPWHVTTAPLWVRRDPSLLNELNAGLPMVPYDDVVLVAAYPLSLLAAPGDLIIYRHGRPPMESGVVEIRVGRITKKDLRAWR